MEANVENRVRNTKLGYSKALLPLFEAVINSIHSINETKSSNGYIEIQIDRESTILQEDVHGNFLPDIAGFTIIDNGIGFDAKHYESFNELDSTMKLEIGGKGIGRIYWLIAFAEAAIESIYFEDNKFNKIQFDFRCTLKGIENVVGPVIDSAGDRQTKVKLKGFKEKFRSNAPKSADAISRRIVEHCLSMFAHGGLPKIVVCDVFTGDCVSLHDLYSEEYQVEVGERTFVVADSIFSIKDVMVKYYDSNLIHSLHFCAHGRSVDDLDLSKKIPPLSVEIIRPGGESVVCCGYVSSDILDKKVDADRSSFDIPKKGGLDFSETGFFWDDVEIAAVKMAEEYLGPVLIKMKEDVYDKAVTFVRKEPKYRILLSHQTEKIKNMSPTLTESQMDTEFHKMLNDWRGQVRLNAKEELDSVVGEDDFEKHKEKFNKILADLQEVSKADLTEYVVHRATVISFFEKLLGNADGQGFPLEKALHHLIFPLKSTTDNIEYDDHNLWLLDERLVYHHYLASDLPFSLQDGSPVKVNSLDRPDLLIYDRSFAYIQGEEPAPAVVIVEFKRPERNEYSEYSSPIAQVIRYVQRIRTGKAKRSDNSSIEPLSESTPFYCYVIATLTPKLREDALGRGFIDMPDHQGYFNYNPNYNAYIEVISYRKVSSDAKKRNKAFFDKLHIPIR